MHHGCVAGANDGEEEAAGGGRHRQALGGAGGVLHPELATDHQEYLSGHGESPGR